MTGQIGHLGVGLQIRRPWRIKFQVIFTQSRSGNTARRSCSIRSSPGPGRLKPSRVATRASLRTVLEEVTIADVATGNLPAVVSELTNLAGAWERRRTGR